MNAAPFCVCLFCSKLRFNLQSSYRVWTSDSKNINITSLCWNINNIPKCSHVVGNKGLIHKWWPHCLQRWGNVLRRYQNGITCIALCTRRRKSSSVMSVSLFWLAWFHTLTADMLKSWCERLQRYVHSDILLLVSTMLFHLICWESRSACTKCAPIISYDCRHCHESSTVYCAYEQPTNSFFVIIYIEKRHIADICFSSNLLLPQSRDML